jgi:hypothetical protein
MVKQQRFNGIRGRGRIFFGKNGNNPESKQHA